MTEEIKTCPECDGQIMRRAIHGTIFNTAPVSESNFHNQPMCEIDEICIKCKEHVCMVKDCNERASHVSVHNFNAGSDKHSVWISNDVCVCEAHKSFILTQDILDKTGMYPLFLMGPILILLLICKP